MMRIAIASFLIALSVLAFACGEDEDMPPAERSGISGLVMAGPQCPVVQAGSPCPDKPLQAKIEITNVDGGAVATVESDADGLFKVNVPPGEYYVVAQPVGDGPFPAPPGEQLATVRTGIITEVSVLYDTGIR